MSDAASASAVDVAKARRRARQIRESRDALQRQRTRELITPEGAGLHLKIASGSERAGAFVIDFILILLSILISMFLLALTASGLGYEGGQIVAALAILIVFLFRNFYWILFELGRKAASPGKRALGLRVAARNGGRLTASAVIARNFMREIEVFLPITFLLQGAIASDSVSGWMALLGIVWSGVFLFFPFFNRDKLRVGDIVAGTWVIHTPKTKLMGDVTRTAAPKDERYVFSQAQLDAYGIHELQVLEIVLRKNTGSVQQDVADNIRKKINWERTPNETDTAFLEAYYAALRRRLEQRMLLGQRKEDKFDT